MITPTWSPDPKTFGSIGDVKQYCIKYIKEELYKSKLPDNIISDKMKSDNIYELTDNEFSILCSDTIKVSDTKLLLKLAKYKNLSNKEYYQLCMSVPAYVEDKILLKFRPDYPLYFAENEEVNYKEPHGKYEQLIYKNLKYKSKPSESRTRHFRIEELYDLTDIVRLLGEANDHRYSEIELCGIILWVYMSKPNPYYLTIFKKLLVRAKHGLELRALLKPYSVSIKRWPTYWVKYLKNNEPYIEVETILGYVITETITPDMLEDLDKQLDITPINYYGGPDFLLRDVDKMIKAWHDVPPRPTKDISLSEFFNSWDLWTTSGSASDYRANVNGKKKRIHKSALPLYCTVKELYEGRLQPSRTSVKAETAKSRLVFATPTYDSLSVSYLLYKYDTHVQNSNTRDYFSFSQEQMLNTSASFIDALKQNKYVGSSDIEKNDWLHNVLFDLYVFVCLIEPVILEEDIPVLLDICSRSTINWIFVPNIKYSSRHVKFSNDKGTHLVSTGALVTGQRRTTLYNGFYNRIYNSLAQIMVSRTIGYDPGLYNIFGGDDSIQLFNDHTAGVLTYIAATTILLTISPLKSFISQNSAEYFRVNYNDKYRTGYSNRVIHSIVSANPTSQQEVDVVLKCKSMYDTLQIFKRRSRSDLTDTIFSLYLKRLEVNPEMCLVPTSAGGIGIGLPSDKILQPGIPRYRSDVTYKPVGNWFNLMAPYLNPYKLEGVLESYIKDMSKGVIDREETKRSRDKYKSSFSYWLGKVKFKNGKNDFLAAISSLDRSKGMLYTINQFTEFSAGVFPTLAGSTAAWQNYVNTYVSDKRSIRIIDKSDTRVISDIINRSEMKKISDKIMFLSDNNLVTFGFNIINRLPGKVLLDLVLSSITGNASNATVPTDMHFIFSVIQPYQQLQKLSYIAQSIVASLSAPVLYTPVRTLYNQLLSW